LLKNTSTGWPLTSCGRDGFSYSKTALLTKKYPVKLPLPDIAMPDLFLLKKNLFCPGAEFKASRMSHPFLPLSLGRHATQCTKGDCEMIFAVSSMLAKSQPVQNQ